jgi:hypothetical protein
MLPMPNVASKCRFLKEFQSQTRHWLIGLFEPLSFTPGDGIAVDAKAIDYLYGLQPHSLEFGASNSISTHSM